VKLRGKSEGGVMRGALVAALLVSVGAIIEYTGRPGSVATAHLLYGWGIIYAICFGRSDDAD
jgi:hypothetical protein